MYRILYVEEGPAIGGSTYTLLHLIQELDRGRFEPFVLFRHELPVLEAFASRGIRTATWKSLGAPPATEAPAAAAGRIPQFKLTAPYRFMYSLKKYLGEQRRDAARLAPWMEREGFSLVHANNAVSSNLGAIIAAGSAAIPVLSHQRGFMRLTPLHRHLARRVTRFLCVSNAVREHYVGQGLPAERVLAIHDGIDLAKFAPRPRERSDGVLVGWFARFEHWKGCFTFAEAARIALGKDPRVRFIMAGTGPEEEGVRGLVAADPVFKDRFSMPGFREDAAGIMARCDVVVNSSIEPEPLSNTALEALALGVPVVASNCGGNPEIVENGVNGLIFERGNHESLASALLDLAADEGRRRRFGAAGRLRAERLFDSARYSSDIQALYSEILEK